MARSGKNEDGHQTGRYPVELREPMGLYVYGCDRCHNVCPRNQPWLAKVLPMNEKVAAKAPDFDLRHLLHMDRSYFNTRIWPHMFYMSDNDIWRWKMNVARVMGNSRDPEYIPDLVQAFADNSDERVTGMIAWALGRIGRSEGLAALKQLPVGSAGRMLRSEISRAISACSRSFI